MTPAEQDELWARATEEVHQIRLGVANVIGQSPYPPLVSMQALALVMLSYAEGLRAGVAGEDGNAPLVPSAQPGFDALPDMVLALRGAADIFHEAHEKGTS